MDRPAFNVLSLFSGAGGLDLGVHRAIRGACTVCYVEVEAYAAAVLAARMEEGALASAPVWSDVRTFDGRPWRGVVDCIAGGFPCVDISVAGRQEGIHAPRSGLWKQYARIVGEVRPRYVFIENVAALTFRGLDVVLADLAALGFDAEWGCLRADDAGAPHGRHRIFVLAHANGEGLQGLHEPGRGVDLQPTPRPLRWEWSPEPCVPRVADGVAGGVEHRTDRIRAIGNGVVPHQAALAIGILGGRMSMFLAGGLIGSDGTGLIEDEPRCATGTIWCPCGCHARTNFLDCNECCRGAAAPASVGADHADAPPSPGTETPSNPPQSQSPLTPEIDG